MDKSLKLILPDIKYKDSFVEAMREGLHLEVPKEKEILLAEQDFDEYIRRRQDLTRRVVLPNGQKVKRLPQIDFWLVRVDRFIGMASFRPQLNAFLRKRGGNIGYAIRKTERQKGYGSLILQLVLVEAKKHGLDKVLITCHDQNLGSIKIIESAGGVLQDKGVIEGLDIPERRYWINF